MTGFSPLPAAQSPERVEWGVGCVRGPPFVLRRKSDEGTVRGFHGTHLSHRRPVRRPLITRVESSFRTRAQQREWQRRRAFCNPRPADAARPECRMRANGERSECPGDSGPPGRSESRRLSSTGGRAATPPRVINSAASIVVQRHSSGRGLPRAREGRSPNTPPVCWTESEEEGS